MTTKFQLSDRRGEAILLAAVEDDDPQVAEAQFAEAVALAGLASAYESFARPAQPSGFQHPNTLGQAQHNVQQAGLTSGQTYGAHPVQPQVPAAAAPSCQHGQKVYKESKPGAPKPWKAWACPARSSDPTRCEFEWIR